MKEVKRIYTVRGQQNREKERRGVGWWFILSTVYKLSNDCVSNLNLLYCTEIILLRKVFRVRRVQDERVEVEKGNREG